MLSGIAFTIPVAGCSLVGSEARYRFRMLIEVQTPTGVKTGFSVMEINAYREPIVIGDRGGGHSGLRGEAVMIDLDEGPIFALLMIKDGGPALAGVVTHALAPETKSPDFNVYLDAVRRLSGASEGKYRAAIPQVSRGNVSGIAEGDKIWPMIVRFRDIHDPTSIEKVDPEAVGVKRILVETTSDRMTTGIDKKLPWLPRVYQMGIGSDFHPAGIPVGDFQSLFSTEVK